MQGNELSYLHVVKPHLHFSDSERIPEKHYPSARARLLDMIKSGTIEKDPERALFLYCQQNLLLGYSVWGLIGVAAVEDFLQNRIMRHEKTLTKKEDLLVQHMEFTQVVGEPVLLTFEGGNWFDDLIANVSKRTVLYDFTTDDGLHHRVWRMADENELNAIDEIFGTKNSNFYIADGHHRSAGAARYFQKLKAEGKITGENHPAGQFLACLVPANQIRLFEFNRLVKDLNGLSQASFLRKLADVFRIEVIGQAKLHVKKKRFRFGMYLGGTWYGLDLLESTSGNVLDTLDVSILENKILRPLLGIENPQTDERLSFLDGTKGIDRLQELVDNGDYQVAFSLFPCKIQDVMEVSHLGLTMPPKSTWFEPKLRTGMLIYSLEH